MVLWAMLVTTLTCFFVYIIAEIVTFLANRKNTMMPIDDSKMCKNHLWKELRIVNPDAEPGAEEERVTAYCTACGYVPQLDAMMKPKKLAENNVLTFAREEALAQRKEFDDLEMEFLELFLGNEADFTAEEKELVSKGYRAHMKFIDYAPLLLSLKAMSKASKKLEEEFKALENSAEAEAHREASIVKQELELLEMNKQISKEEYIQNVLKDAHDFDAYLKELEKEIAKSQNPDEP
jgi:hypothetical protein